MKQCAVCGKPVEAGFVVHKECVDWINKVEVTDEMIGATTDVITTLNSFIDSEVLDDYSASRQGVVLLTQIRSILLSLKLIQEEAKCQ